MIANNCQHLTIAPVQLMAASFYCDILVRRVYGAGWKLHVRPDEIVDAKDVDPTADAMTEVIPTRIFKLRIELWKNTVGKCDEMASPW